MDEKTESLRDIFIETTGSEAVTESQEASRGSLADRDVDVADRLRDLVGAMRVRYSFRSDLADDALVALVRGFYDGLGDDALAARVDADAAAVFAARLDLHLVRERDRDAPFEFQALKRRVAQGASDEDLADDLDVDPESVTRYRRVAEADLAATRANDRYRDEFEALLTDADIAGPLASDAREDGLEDATEDIETDVSF